MKKHYLLLLLAFVFVLTAGGQTAPIRVIVFGAHPDDCDLEAGGTAIKFVKMGCKVKFVSMTNGDAGHQSMGGGVLAKRRMAEAQEAGRRFGVEYTVIDNHDGELMPTLENRLKVIREIRNWKADIVITHPSNDYHPDHRYTSLLVQDASFMVLVPNVAPDTPRFRKTLYSSGRILLIPTLPSISTMWRIRKFMLHRLMNLSSSNGFHGSTVHSIRSLRARRRGSFHEIMADPSE